MEETDLTLMEFRFFERNTFPEKSEQAMSSEMRHSAFLHVYLDIYFLRSEWMPSNSSHKACQCVDSS